jgi:hypothetical protein
MIPPRVTGDLLVGMWQLIVDRGGGVPRTLLWDNESVSDNAAGSLMGSPGSRGVLGTRLIQARSYAPETKGLAERANGYLRSSFLPSRSFASPADLNTQIGDWLTAVANLRKHATPRMIPVEALTADRAAVASGHRPVGAGGLRHRAVWRLDWIDLRPASRNWAWTYALRPPEPTPEQGGQRRCHERPDDQRVEEQSEADGGADLTDDDHVADRHRRHREGEHQARRGNH